MRRVQDRIVEDSGVHTVEQLGRTQHRTREGYLLCMDVPLARTGIQDYLNSELVTGADDDCEPGTNGIIRVERTEDEVFHPDSIASFNGKDVVDDHPDEDVQPHNYKTLTCGTVLHPRRGEGEWSDYMVADLLIKDKDAIEAVLAGKRQVSNGYDADYESLGPGRARQHNIRGNHVALVDRGRCGRKCSIGDSEMTAKKSFLDRLAAAFSTKDKAAFDEVMGEMGAQTVKDPATAASGPEALTTTHVHIHLPGEQEVKGDPVPSADELPENEGIPGAAPAVDPMEARIAAIEATLLKIAEMMAGKTPGADEVPAEGEDQQGEAEAEGAVPEAGAEKKEPVVDAEPDEEDKDKKGNPFKDSAHLVDEFRSVVSDAAIIAPSLKMPTHDSAAKPRSTRDTMCLLRRRALAASIRTDDGADILEQLTGKRTIDGSMPCAQLGIVFKGAVALTKDRNTVIDRGGKRPSKDKDITVVNSVADLNATLRQRYGQQPPTNR